MCAVWLLQTVGTAVSSNDHEATIFHPELAPGRAAAYAPTLSTWLQLLFSDWWNGTRCRVEFDQHHYWNVPRRSLIEPGIKQSTSYIWGSWITYSFEMWNEDWRNRMKCRELRGEMSIAARHYSSFKAPPADVQRGNLNPKTWCTAWCTSGKRSTNS